MNPFVVELAARLAHAAREPAATNLPRVEAIAAPPGLLENADEVGVDRGNRIRRREESLELRMVAVPAGPPEHDRLRKQRLAPESHEPFDVEVRGVQGPEAHGKETIAGR